MGPFGSSIRVNTFVGSGVPIISGEHLHGSRLRDGAFNFITAEHADRLARSNVCRGDIVLTHAGTIGQAALIPQNSRFERYVISQRQFYVRCDRSRLLPEFLTYFFHSSHGRHLLLANTSSSGVPSIARPVSYLRGLNIRVPPLEVQRAVADVLGALDDKIELNRRMNETLESFVRQLYRRLEREAADTSSVYEYAAVAYGAPFASASFNTTRDGMPLIRIRDLATFDPEVWTEEEHPRATVIEPGDLVVGMDGEFRAQIWLGRRALLNQRVCSFRPRNGVPTAFLWQAIRDDLAFYEQAKTGTTVIHLGKADIDKFTVPAPEPGKLAAFGEQADPLVARLVVNAKESRTLAELRDALLPKLISGELRVRDLNNSS